MIFTPIKPMLLHTGSKVLDDNQWIYDIKWDGWRILIHKEGNRIEAYTRHGNLVTDKFPELQKIGGSIKEHTAILDCEGVVLRNGNSVFEDMAYRGRMNNPSKIQQALDSHPVTFVVFDVLSTNKPHLTEPLTERKKIISSIIAPSNYIVTTPSIVGEGTHLFQLTKEKNMEGIIGKRANSSYHLNHRSYDWLKFKHFKTKKATILGWKENPFTMVVGEQLTNGSYIPVASLEFGFKPEEKQAFRKIAKGIIQNKNQGITWVEPVLNCYVQYLEETNNKKLRIASFKGFDLQ